MATDSDGEISRTGEEEEGALATAPHDGGGGGGGDDGSNTTQRQDMRARAKERPKHRAAKRGRSTSQLLHELRHRVRELEDENDQPDDGSGDRRPTARRRPDRYVGAIDPDMEAHISWLVLGEIVCFLAGFVLFAMMDAPPVRLVVSSYHHASMEATAMSQVPW